MSTLATFSRKVQPPGIMLRRDFAEPVRHIRTDSDKIQQLAYRALTELAEIRMQLLTAYDDVQLNFMPSRSAATLVSVTFAAGGTGLFMPYPLHDE